MWLFCLGFPSYKCCLWLSSLSLPPKCYHLPSVYITPIIFLPPAPNAPCPRILSLTPSSPSWMTAAVSFLTVLPSFRTLSYTYTACCQKILPEQSSHQVIACLKSSNGSSQPLHLRNNPHLGTQALHDLTPPLPSHACIFPDHAIM